MRHNVRGRLRILDASIETFPLGCFEAEANGRADVLAMLAGPERRAPADANATMNNQRDEPLVACAIHGETTILWESLRPPADEQGQRLGGGHSCAHLRSVGFLLRHGSSMHSGGTTCNLNRHSP